MVHSAGKPAALVDLPSVEQEICEMLVGKPQTASHIHNLGKGFDLCHWICFLSNIVILGGSDANYSDANDYSNGIVEFTSVQASSALRLSTAWGPTGNVGMRLQFFGA